MRFRLDVRDAYLHLEAAGAFDADIARQAIREVFEACATNRLGRVFIDARGLAQTVPIAERFEVARALAEHRAGAVRIAILVDASQMVTKTLEDSASNRGVPIRTTAIPEEAYGFLGVKPPG